MRREAPEPWASAMLDLGYEYGGRASIRRLAAAARRETGTDAPADSAVHKVVMGEVSSPEDSTINALALALKKPATVISSWVGQSRQVAAPWVPPEGADRLTRKQREALEQLIRVMVDREERDSGGDTAPKTPAGDARDDRWQDHVTEDQLGLAADEGDPQPGYDSQTNDDK